MARRTHGQFCGLARALELIGERWALMIVRDLLVSPKRFTDLRNGLPRIPTNILSARLKELEENGLIQRRVLPRPASSIVYELTEYGSELEDIVLRLGRWGAKRLGEPGPYEIVTVDSLVFAMRTTFQPEAARDDAVSYVWRTGKITIHMHVKDGTLEVAGGDLPEADLVIEGGPAIRALMAGELSAEEAIAGGDVRLTGDPALLARFAQTFQI